MANKSGLTLAFDIGHASIGWAVLKPEEPPPVAPEILSCGAVTFPTDDCLASQRRGFRRQRRHIRATRHRIGNLKKLLLHLGVLDRAALDAPGHPAPWKLAARVLQDGGLLDWEELWNVIRWYAHNRGYDGNRRWSKQEDIDTEDTLKEQTAIDLMATHDTDTMAETVCKQLGVDPFTDDEAWRPAYKTHHAAFPRSVVIAEVRRILERHLGTLPRVDQSLIDTLIEAENRPAAAGPAWKTIHVPELNLPRRYHGGLLFGQRVPRFDNRIIGICPFLFPRLLNQYLEKGMDPPTARKRAERNAKKPLKSCREFLGFRWALLLANIRVDGQPLSRDTRRSIDSVMRSKGRLTYRGLVDLLDGESDGGSTNLEATFAIHPDSEDALFLDPAKALHSGEGPGSKNLKPFWKHLPEDVRGRALGRWRKGKTISLEWMLTQVRNDPARSEALEEAIENALRRSKGKTRLTREALLRKAHAPKPLTGRAPYSRTIMRSAYDEVLDGFDPRKPRKSAEHPDGDEKDADGSLYRSPSIRKAERDRGIDALTNNHLVRHRLRILGRLTEDIVRQFADDDKRRVTQIVVEVARDLQEYSGMTAKEIKRELNGRLRHFKEAVACLEEKGVPVTGGMIRKARIAMDLDWKCPFTGKPYDAVDLQRMEREHVIPYSKKKTNALYALVLTFPEINRLKGNRTAREFVSEFGGQDVPGTEGRLTIRALRAYDDAVAKLDTKGHPDDMNRKRRRKALLQITEFREREQGFTEGMLTQSSQLMRLAQRQMEQRFGHLAGNTQSLPALPGQITALTRKAWDVLGCLARAAPETEDTTKTEVREITHLHHALDAVVIGLTAHCLPNNGLVWESALARNPTPTQKAALKKIGYLEDGNGRMHLAPLTPETKNAIAERLAECRVVQHVPADMSGVRAEQNTWRVLETDGEDGNAMVTLEQRTSEVRNGARTRSLKTTKERSSRLLGIRPTHSNGKLAALKGVLVLNENYGVALDPEPAIIPFFKVWHTLQELKRLNQGTPPRIVRTGMLIRIASNPKTAKQDYTGIWRVASVKNNASGIALDIVRPHYVKAQNRVNWSGMNKLLKPLLACGLEIVEHDYTGIAI